MKFFYSYQAIFMPSHVNMVRYDINNRLGYYDYYKVHHINHKLMNGFLRGSVERDPKTPKSMAFLRESG